MQLCALSSLLFQLHHSYNHHLLHPQSPRLSTTRIMSQSSATDQPSLGPDDEGWTSVPAGKPGKKNRGQRNKQEDAWKGPLLSVEFIPPDPSTSSDQFQPFLLLLAGLPGSGKSSFANLLQSAKPYKFARINQDQLGSRKRCVAAAQEAMAEGRCVVVDRCNFDASQRQTWYDLAGQHGYPVDCLVLQVPPRLCIERCQGRKGHETVKPEDASRVVNIVKKQFRLPSRDEMDMLRSSQIVRSSNEFNEAVLMYLNKK